MEYVNTLLEIISLTVVLGLTSYRLTRLITTDTFPPVQGFRRWVRRRTARAEDDGWQYELITCPWCMGAWISGALVLITDLFVSVPYPWLMWGVVATITGFIGQYDESPDD